MNPNHIERTLISGAASGQAAEGTGNAAIDAFLDFSAMLSPFKLEDYREFER